MNEETPPILIYFKFRGQLQPVRNLLCYLDVPFLEVHPEFLEEERPSLPARVKEVLRGVKIDRNRLPLLFYEGHTVYQPHAIMNFLCRRFGREDLLGTTPREKARLMEMLEVYFMRQPQCMNELSRLSDLAATQGVELMGMELRKSFEGVMNRSGYIREICEYLDGQLNPRFILAARLTIADFLFLETCNYTLGLFEGLERTEWEGEVEGTAGFGEESYRRGKKPNPYYLRVLRQYRQRMQAQPFYTKHAALLESFSIISSFTGQQRADGLRSIWQLEQYFVK